MNFWPFWLGGAALAAVAVGYCFLLRRLLGVSGSFAIALGERPAASRVDPAALEAALLEATEAEFGEQPSESEPAPSAPAPAMAAPLDRLSHVLLLGAILVGGAIGALTRGAFRVRGDLGPEFARVIGVGWQGLAALVLGGVLVGFGTQMAGGCTSGHGLCGTSRLQRGSLLATVAFFGVAVAVSLAIEMVRR
jgi:uncharacterized membrane protein YedE/YeeE